MQNTAKFNFVGRFVVFAVIAALCILPGLVALLGAPFGLNLFNLDVDFVGGTTMQYALHRQVSAEDIAAIHELVKDVSGEAASSVVTAGDGTEVIIKTHNIPTEMRDAINDSMKEQFSITDDDRLDVDNVSAAVGKDLRTSAFKAAGVASVLMLLYITFRFSFTSGASSVICIVHDVLVMLSACVVLRISINTGFIAAALIIFGYSINASIVTFDRIRENRRLLPKENAATLVNVSVWQSLTRTINTTLTTLFTIVALFVLGVPSIRTFSLPIIIGIVAGAYSSTFLAGPMWALMQKSKK